MDKPQSHQSFCKMYVILRWGGLDSEIFRKLERELWFLFDESDLVRLFLLVGIPLPGLLSGVCQVWVTGTVYLVKPSVPPIPGIGIGFILISVLVSVLISKIDLSSICVGLSLSLVSVFLWGLVLVWYQYRYLCQVFYELIYLISVPYWYH